MLNTHIEPIAQVRPGALNAEEIAEMVWRIVYARGRHQVSMDTDGAVYATPADHPFSKSMLRQYADRIVGTYTTEATVDDITGDLLEQWKGDREARA